MEDKSAAQPSCSQKASAWGTWAASHPKGQLAALLVFTLPLGIWGLVNSQNSANALSDAISDFDKILDNWKTTPFTKVKIIDRTADCSSSIEGGVAYSDYGKQRWLGANAGPCACPDTTYQVNIGIIPYRSLPFFLQKHPFVRLHSPVSYLPLLLQPFNTATNGQCNTAFTSIFAKTGYSARAGFDHFLSNLF